MSNEDRKDRIEYRHLQIARTFAIKSAPSADALVIRRMCDLAVPDPRKHEIFAKRLSFPQCFRLGFVDRFEQVIENALLPGQNVHTCDHSWKNRKVLIPSGQLVG